MHQTRRRKKKPSYGVRTVEIIRSKNGYGFTISGQAPCMLSCIVSSSPAERAGLKPGDYLVAVNGQNVSKALHDDVVCLIGNSGKTLKLQIAANYYSDSSDDELISSNVLKSKQANRTQPKNTSARLPNRPLFRAEKVIQDLNSGILFQHQHLKPANPKACTLKAYENLHDSEFLSDGQRTPLNSNTIAQKENLQNPGHQQKIENSFHDFCLVESKYNSQKRCLSYPIASSPTKQIGLKENVRRFSVEPNELNTFIYPSLQHLQNNWNVILKNAVFKTVVGYLGTIEMPKDIRQCCNRLQAISNCIRRLRVEKKVHTFVLLTIYTDKITLINPHGNVIATYPAEKIISSGVYSSDKKFFGLVTAHEDIETLRNFESELKYISSSCHVFMVDPKIVSHDSHVSVAKMFSIKCNTDINSFCPDFLDSAEPVMLAVNSLYQETIDYNHLMPGLIKVNLPDIPQHNNTSSNSSNTDSGIVFHEDNYNSEQVFVVNVVNNVHESDSDYTNNLRGVAKDSDVINLTLRNLDLHMDDQAKDRLTVRVMQNCTDNDEDDEKISDKYCPEMPVENASKGYKFPLDNQYGSVKCDNLQLEPDSSLTNVSAVGSKSDPFKDNCFLNPNNIVMESTASNVKSLIKEFQTEHSITQSKVSPELKDSLSNPVTGTKLKDDELKQSNKMEIHETWNSSIKYNNKESLKLDEPAMGLECNSTSEGQIVGRVTKWAIGFEYLLEDLVGLHTFAEFLKNQFSYENINFWVACERYRKFADSSMIQFKANEIYIRHLCIGAAEPVNVDSSARQIVEDALENPTKNLFNVAQKQIYSLMKFDCYARFLKSSLFKDCLMKEIAGESLPFQGDDELNPNLPYFQAAKEMILNQKDSDKGEVEETRRKSLLPWNRIKSSKEKENKKKFFMKTSELCKSFCRKDKKKEMDLSYQQENSAAHSSLATSDLIVLHQHSLNQKMDSKSTSHSSRIMNLVRRNSIHFIPDMNNQSKMKSKQSSCASVHEVTSFSSPEMRKMTSKKLFIKPNENRDSRTQVKSENIDNEQKRKQLICDYLTV